MKKILLTSTFTFISLLSLIGCASDDYFKPNKHLSPKEIDALKYNIVRNIGRLPKNATNANKYDTQFDEAYKLQSKHLTLSKYYKDATDTIFFEMNKMARSLKFKKVAIGGKMVVNPNNKEIIYYEECYRTWKMDTTLLNERTAIIFKDFTSKKPLHKYYTENTNDDTHIEFPNQHTTYNIAERKWVSNIQTFNFE